ncbi:hypothetical protein NA610_23090, partial [Salmonella sp. NW387]|uniref:hypothetical protein n=1 Tax=Salmonella sp. NW387 TaxID=2947947 RepID=UPI003F43B395
HIARESLYRKSGHLPYYAESMFPPMEFPLDPEFRAFAERNLKKAEREFGEVMERIKRSVTGEKLAKITRELELDVRAGLTPHRL